MKRLFTALCAVTVCAAFGTAQTTDDGYKKGEFFVGYSNQQVDTGLGNIDDDLGFDLDDREGFHGLNVSAVYNVGRYFGLKADVSGTYSNQGYSFTVPTAGGGTGSVGFETKSSLYNFLGGVQIKNNSHNQRLKPFAHAMVGAAHTRVKLSGLGCSVGVDCTAFEGGSETNLSGVFGGGLDIKLSRRVQLRAIQVDYNPIWFDGGRQNNIRLGFGFVF